MHSQGGPEQPRVPSVLLPGSDSGACEEREAVYHYLPSSSPHPVFFLPVPKCSRQSFLIFSSSLTTPLPSCLSSSSITQREEDRIVSFLPFIKCSRHSFLISYSSLTTLLPFSLPSSSISQREEDRTVYTTERKL